MLPVAQWPRPARWNFDINSHLDPWLPPPPWPHLWYPIAYLFGYRKQKPSPLGNILCISWAFIGVFTAITFIELVNRQIPSFRERDAPLIVGSFGAAAVLQFYAIDSPLSAPRNAVLGQVFGAIIGVGIRQGFDLNAASLHHLWAAGALSCASATAFMAITGTVHPPAGATALLAVVDERSAKLGWFFLPLVTLASVEMQAVALVINNIQRRYPNYWWTPGPVSQAWRKDKQGDEEAEVGRDSREEKGNRQHAISDSDSVFSASGRARDMDEGKGGGERQLVVGRGGVARPHDLVLSYEEETVLARLAARM